jgi:leucine-rich repeat transmembrane protein FLRT
MQQFNETPSSQVFKALQCLILQKVVTLGEETINTPIFTQLDHGQVYLVTDQLTRFVLVGESAGSCNKAVKILRLAVFAPSPILHPQSLDYNVRVYTLEDNMAALEVTAIEIA